MAQIKSSIQQQQQGQVCHHSVLFSRQLRRAAEDPRSRRWQGTSEHCINETQTRQDDWEWVTVVIQTTDHKHCRPHCELTAVVKYLSSHNEHG